MPVDEAFKQLRAELDLPDKFCAMKVIVTEAAYADLLHIGRAIGVDNPARAESFVAELHDRCHRLSAMPRAFRFCRIGRERGVQRVRTAII